MHLAPGAGDRCGEHHSHDLLVYRVRRNRDSIEAHLAIVFARPGRHAVHRGPHRPVRQEIRPHARRYRAVQIYAGRHALTAEDPPPPGLRNALAHIKQQERGMH